MTLTVSSSPSKKAINALAKNYNALHYYLHLLNLLSDFYPAEKLERSTKYQLHKLTNSMLMKHYDGEEVMKYKIASLYFNKAKIVGAYEINVNTSRADFVTINGHSTSFEIKSGLDNLSKLPKQITDYSEVFDYSCLAVDIIHFEKAKNLLPKTWGLWCYENGEYSVYRKPSLNTSIDPEAQLKLLSKSELVRAFPDQRGLQQEIIKGHGHEVINTMFKEVLKARYRSRWQFLTAHQSNILPIDSQFFFNNNVLPQLLYQKR